MKRQTGPEKLLEEATLLALNTALCGYIDCGYRYVVWQLSWDGIIYDCVGIYTRRDNAIRGARRFAKKEGYDKIKEIY